MKRMLERRSKYVRELKDIGKEMLKKYDKDSDMLDFINKMNYTILIDDGLLEEYENICKLYYNRDYCNDIFDKVLMLIKNNFGDYIKNIEEKDIDLRVLVFKQSTPNEVVIKLLEKMDNDEYINSKLGWSFEYDHRSGLYKLSLWVKEV